MQQNLSRIAEPFVEYAFPIVAWRFWSWACTVQFITPILALFMVIAPHV